MSSKKADNLSLNETGFSPDSLILEIFDEISFTKEDVNGQHQSEAEQECLDKIEVLFDKLDCEEEVSKENTKADVKIPDNVTRRTARAYINRLFNAFPELCDAANDCCSRFLNSLPITDLRDQSKLFYAVEKAHWWYTDMWRVGDNLSRLPRLSILQFGLIATSSNKVLEYILSPKQNVQILSNWRKQKRFLPARGAILLDPTFTKCVLVADYNNGQWSFPKGRLEVEESDVTAAIREVNEECGIDITTYINPQWYIQTNLKGYDHKMFIVPLMQKENFKTLTRMEIRDIKWVNIANLVHKKDELLNLDKQVFALQKSKIKFWDSQNFIGVKDFMEGVQVYSLLFREGSITSSSPNIDINTAFRLAADPDNQTNQVHFVRAQLPETLPLNILSELQTNSFFLNMKMGEKLQKLQKILNSSNILAKTKS